MKILSFGEILWDVYPDSKAIGGASLNLAAHAALLGAEVYIASAVGNDALGKEALEKTKSFGIIDSFISISESEETGSVIVSLNEKGIPSYEIKDNVAYDKIPVSNIGGVDFDVLVFGTLALRHGFNKNSISSLIKRISFSEIYTDLNVRLPHSNKDSVDFCLSNSTIVKISDEELPFVSDWIFGKAYANEAFAAEASMKYPNLKLIIITMGEKGSLAFDVSSSIFYYSKAIPTSVVSTVGAGDSFGAAFLTKYLSDGKIQASLDFASKISSYVCSQKEAVPDTKNIT